MPFGGVTRFQRAELFCSFFTAKNLWCSKNKQFVIVSRTQGDDKTESKTNFPSLEYIELKDLWEYSVPVPKCDIHVFLLLRYKNNLLLVS